MLNKIYDFYFLGMALAGAGGGGFIYAITKEPKNKEEIQNLIDASNLNMQIYQACIAIDGIEFNFV